jgi:hypothetical protein
MPVPGVRMLDGMKKRNAVSKREKAQIIRNFVSRCVSVDYGDFNRNSRFFNKKANYEADKNASK